MVKIALGMIVKNEVHCIERCLESVKSLVNDIYINDNGSTDGTKDKIFDWCKKNELPVTILNNEWESFDVNRSLVLSSLYSYGKDIDYVLMIDADEVIVLEAGFNVEKWKESLICDIYDIETKLGGIGYLRPQLTTNKKKFAYAGVVHEFLKPLEETSSRDTVRGFFNMPLQDSSRNKDPEKYKKDAIELHKAIQTETDPFIKSRYTFYYAQSCRDSGQNLEAVLSYENRADMEFWGEERYISLLNSGRLKRAIPEYYPLKESNILDFVKAIDFSPRRAETLYEAMITCRDMGKFSAAFVFGKEAFDKIYTFFLDAPDENRNRKSVIWEKDKPTGCLFLENWIYDYALAFELSVIAWYSDNKELAKQLTQYTINNIKAPIHMKEQSIKNLEFYK